MPHHDRRRRLAQSTGGQVFIHRRRNVDQPGERFVVAIVPVRGERWESCPYEAEEQADVAAAALAAFVGGTVQR